jgi:hypothetical protein
MMFNMRRLNRLTSLYIVGFANLVGDAPITALATSLPPDLAILELELSVDYRNMVKATGCMSFCRGRCTILGRRCCIC